MHQMSVDYSKEGPYQDVGNLWPESSINSSESSRSSSTQSWIDESEQSVARELKEQYDKFEEALYCERSPCDLPKSLQAEVKIWSEHSPHIRVRGFRKELHERPDSLVEEAYDSNYEEIIQSHGSLEESLEKGISYNDDVRQMIESCPSEEQEVIKTDLKNAIVDKLLGHALPRVLEKFEPVIKSISAGRRKEYKEIMNTSEIHLNNVKNQQNERLTARSYSSHSCTKDLIARKPLPVDNASDYRSALSSHGLRHYENNRILGHSSATTRDNLSNFGVPEIKINRASSLSTQQPSRKPLLKSKSNGIKKVKPVEEKIMLPAIEAVPITPKSPDKRSVSAMVRFTKTLPRVGPNTARSRNEKPKNPLPSDIDLGSNGEPLYWEKSSFVPDLQVVGTRSTTSLKANRWRY